VLCCPGATQPVRTVIIRCDPFSIGPKSLLTAGQKPCARVRTVGVQGDHGGGLVNTGDGFYANLPLLSPAQQGAIAQEKGEYGIIRRADYSDRAPKGTR
jgi:hypothetical protein